FVEYLYNDRQFIEQVLNKRSNLEVISSFTYTYDSAGNTIKMTEADGSITEWSYDELYRLIRETKYDAQGNITHDVSYTYDGVGNRLSKTDNITGDVVNYSYDVMNRMEGYGGVSYSYDANGNTVSKSVNNQTTIYEWDYDNRLKRVSLPDGSSVSYEYNGEGFRVKRVCGNEVKWFVYDGTKLVAELDGDGGLVRVFTYGRDKLVSMRVGARSNFYLTDVIGSTTEISDGSGVVTDRYRYDAWGNVLIREGSTENPFEYIGTKGYYAEGVDGMKVLGGRQYWSEVGRFASADRVLTSLSRYAYANNSPLVMMDSSGMQAIPTQPWALWAWVIWWAISEFQALSGGWSETVTSSGTMTCVSGMSWASESRIGSRGGYPYSWFLHTTSTWWSCEGWIGACYSA
ncbi:MAG TPA: hypothetical protein EYP10_11595, partial [Armatimonadetes bacterium]|nr:hypothetical protein [Armatimonadota bacterium]